MKRYGYIYKITNLINGKIYIGQTVQEVKQRWQCHVRWSNKYKNNSYLHSAIRKYGESNFKVETIDIAFTLDELNNKEKYWVDYYHTQNPDIGYNSVPGGICNPMNIDKIKIKHDNIMRSEDTRKKISESMKKYRATHTITEETRRKLSAHQKGQVWVNKNGKEKRIWPNELQKYINNGYTLGNARTMSAAQKQALNESHYKQVVCINESGTVIKKFDTVRDASIWLNERLKNKYKHLASVANIIKKSADKNVYINNDIKWQYL